jgi:outer membrane protein OmpA-like peptidoglycan-associated protein
MKLSVFKIIISTFLLKNANNSSNVPVFINHITYPSNVAEIYLSPTDFKDKYLKQLITQFKNWKTTLINYQNRYEAIPFNQLMKTLQNEINTLTNLSNSITFYPGSFTSDYISSQYIALKNLETSLRQKINNLPTVTVIVETITDTYIPPVYNNDSFIHSSTEYTDINSSSNRSLGTGETAVACIVLLGIIVLFIGICGSSPSSATTITSYSPPRRFINTPITTTTFINRPHQVTTTFVPTNYVATNYVPGHFKRKVEYVAYKVPRPVIV